VGAGDVRAAGGAIMTILGLVITLIVIGILLWLVETYIPMDPTIKRILYAVVIICVVLWLLTVFGVLSSTPLNAPVPRLR
jgi:hypothetical protein